METLRISMSSWQHYFLAGWQLSRLEQTFFLPSTHISSLHDSSHTKPNHTKPLHPPLRYRNRKIRSD